MYFSNISAIIIVYLYIGGDQLIILNENELKMLQMIRRNPGCTKSELATKVEMPWSSAYNIISKLGDKIVLFQDEDNNSSINEGSNNYKAGLYINANYEYYVGISVGTSQIKVVLLSFDFSILDFSSEDSPISLQVKNFSYQISKLGFKNSSPKISLWCTNTPDNSEELRNILIDVCENIMQLNDNGINIVAVKFALPGHIDYYNQRIISTGNLCNKSEFIKNSDISRLISSSIHEKFHKKNIEIYIDHNVKCSAIAEKEHLFAEHLDKNDLLVLYLGRGVGCSMIINGELYRDIDNSSGQFGEIKVIYNSKIKKIGAIIREDIFLRNDINLSITELQNTLLNDKKSKELLVDVLSQALSNFIYTIGIKNIIFSGKFDAILDVIEYDLSDKLEEFGIFGVKLMHSTFEQYSAAVGAAMGCFYHRYNINYSWF